MPKVKPKTDFPLHVDANQEVVKNTNVGDDITVMVKGKVSAVEQRERTIFPEEQEAKDAKEKKETVYEVGINVDTIEFSYPNEFSELSED